MDGSKMLLCGLCRKQILTPAGQGPDKEDLCGACFSSYRDAVQRTCIHETVESGRCVDCQKRQWSFGFIAGKVGKGFAIAGGGVAKAFMLYTIPSVISSGVLAAAAYFVAKKLGLF
jgi:outer membrane lipoprotein SlyB